VRGRRVLVIVPDHTRTAPIDVLFRVLHGLMAGRYRILGGNMQTAIQIRRASPHDCSAIVDLVAELRLEELGAVIDTAPVLASVRLCIGDPATTVYVADHANNVIGFAIVHWIPFPMLGGFEAYVSDLIVARARRGAGVGQALIGKVECEAIERRCVRLMLNNRMTAKSFQRGFYEKHGFRHRSDFANFVKALDPNSLTTHHYAPTGIPVPDEET